MEEEEEEKKKKVIGSFIMAGHSLTTGYLNLETAVHVSAQVD
jgi:hypothetical protein